MKKIIIILVALVSLVSLNQAQAQTKIGHVNSQKVLDSIPSRKAAIKDLQEMNNTAEKELDEMAAELQKGIDAYLATKDTKSPMVQQMEESRLQKKQQTLQQRESELQQMLQVRGNELNAPILARMQKAVDIVAERKKINYVIDETVTLYFKGGIDLTNEVLTEVLRLDKEETTKK